MLPSILHLLYRHLEQELEPNHTRLEKLKGNLRGRISGGDFKALCWNSVGIYAFPDLGYYFLKKRIALLSKVLHNFAHVIQGFFCGSQRY